MDHYDQQGNPGGATLPKRGEFEAPQFEDTNGNPTFGSPGAVPALPSPSVRASTNGTPKAVPPASQMPLAGPLPRRERASTGDQPALPPARGETTTAPPVPEVGSGATAGLPVTPLGRPQPRTVARGIPSPALDPSLPLEAGGANAGDAESLSRTPRLRPAPSRPLPAGRTPESVRTPWINSVADGAPVEAELTGPATEREETEAAEAAAAEAAAAPSLTVLQACLSESGEGLFSSVKQSALGSGGGKRLLVAPTARVGDTSSYRTDVGEMDGHGVLNPVLPVVGLGGQEVAMSRLLAPLIDQARSFTAALLRGALMVYLEPVRSLGGGAEHSPVRVWARVDRRLQTLQWTQSGGGGMDFGEEARHWSVELRDIVLVSCGQSQGSAAISELLRRERRAGASDRLRQSLFSLAVPSFVLPVEFLAQSAEQRAEWVAALSLLCSILPAARP